ncbi:MAG: putative baseplate assembly protein [Desulfobacteraceae bacterium]|nr:putative baseplate assembly protein [Desulfobacteraceae bacterium]
MIHKAPKIDCRTEEDIFRYTAEKLKDRLAVSVDRDPLARALLRVFSRYCGHVIQRMNQVPDKNRIAFLNVLNVSRIPPVPARVPLTFTPVKTPSMASSGIVVPAYTKVAASPGEGETEAAVFETMFDLAVTNVELKKVLALDSRTDRYADKSFLATVGGKAGPGQFAFAADQPAGHGFCLGFNPIGERDDITELRIRFEIGNSGVSSCPWQTLEWYIPALDSEISMKPAGDTTRGLSQSGEVVFRNLPEWPTSPMHGRDLAWLSCRSSGPLPAAAKGETPPQLPLVRTVTASAGWDVSENVPAGAFFNNLPIDFSKDFFPFGQRPQFGDLFYLGCDFLATQQCEVTLKIKMTNPASDGKRAPIAPVNRAGDPRIQWEYWNGRRWVGLECRDDTQALTEDGRVSFVVPPPSARTTVNGVEGAWIRARLISGNYGREERFEFDNADQRLRHIPATLAPPCIETVTLASSLTAGSRPPELVVTDNNLVFEEINGRTPFHPFQGASEPYRALYLGFSVPEGEQNAFADRGLDLYFHVCGAEGSVFVRDDMARAQLAWQYWNGGDWIETSAKDGTGALNMSGLVTVRLGADIARWNECSIEGGSELHWLRLLWKEGAFECRPKLQRVVLNTVPATQTMTLENELLGSGNGRPMQTFRSSRVPILQDVHLQVREPDMPPGEELETPGEELERILEQDGMEAVETIRNAQGEIEKIWIRWQEVNDFISSGNRDRHFVVDRQSGEICFGDGQRGLIPPPGVNNVRLRRYRTGGGSFGDKPAESITQLRTSVPYVDSVVNLEPALGGQDIEDWNSVRERGSRWLRHRDRAVTIEDYEDLAKLAAPVVARAKCYPNRDLASDRGNRVIKPGVISLIIVPHGMERKPLPDLNLLRRVTDYINQRRLPDPELVVLAPEYVQVCVEAVIVAGTGHGEAGVLDRCRLELDRYLHPLTGGADGNGWEFGERPHGSDLYVLLESIRGLEYVHSLDIRPAEESPGLLQTGIFLITPGEYNIRLGV